MHASCRLLLSGTAVAAVMVLSGVPARAAAYTWASAASGNWSTTTNWLPNGDPNTSSDTVLINATGSAYMATVNAARTIGSLTLNSADATLNASNTLQFSAASGTVAFNRGTIKGTFTFDEDSTAVTVDKANVTIGGTTKYQFRRASTGNTKSLTFNAGDLATTETLDILGTDSPYPRGNLNVTTANGYTNNGAVSVNATGADYGYPLGSQGCVAYTITNGTLTNNGNVTLSNANQGIYSPASAIRTSLLNNTTGTFTANGPYLAVSLSKAGAAHENRNVWTVTGTGGLTLAGNGTTFTQSTPGAVLNASGSLLTMSNSLGSPTYNTFTLTNGSVQGGFEFHGTNVILGAGRTVAGPTTWSFVRAGVDGASPAPPYVYYNYTGTLTIDEVRANETLQIRNNNSGGYGYRAYTSITQTGGFVNKGTIILHDNMNYHDNPDRAELLITGGTLTNRAQLTLQDVSSAADDGPRVTGEVLNDTTGTVTLSATATGQTVLGGNGNTVTNRGAITATGTGRFYLGGSTGGGSVFLQDVASAAINGPAATGYMTMWNSAAGAQNSFTISAGSVSGRFDFRKTDVTVAAGVAVTGPTTWNFSRNGADTYNHLATFTRSTLTANEALTIGNNNVGGAGYRLRTTITVPGTLANYGSIWIEDAMNYHDSADQAELFLGANTLTNRGSITLRNYGVANTESRITGPVVNETGGTITFDTGNGLAVLGTVGIAQVNRGTMIAAAGANNQVNGTSLTNDTGGIIRGPATATLGGSATLDNTLGTVETVGGASPVTFTLSSPLSAGTRSGTSLVAGTYRVTGGSAATALNISTIGGAGSLATLGTPSGAAAVVTLDGANAAFTQIETASGDGSLATIAATGRLNVTGGKTFTTAASLSDAGMVSVGASSFLKLGSAGSGTLNLASGGTVGGTGTVQGNIAAAGSGTVSPGSSIGTLTTSGNLAFSGTANALAVEFDSTLSDLISVGGLLSLGTGATTLNLTPLSGTILPLTGTTYTIASYGTQTGTFSSILGPSRYQYFLNYGSGTNSSITLLVVPEPATAGLLALAAALALRRRRA